MFFILLVLYFIFVGTFSLTNIILGVIVAALLTVFCRKFVTGPADKFSLFKWIAKIEYFLMLLWEIIKANVDVLKIIYSKKQIEPRLTHFKSNLESQSGNVLVANSITLTPGTFTCELTDEGEFAVHSIDKSFSIGLEKSTFFKKVKAMEEMK